MMRIKSYASQVCCPSSTVWSRMGTGRSGGRRRSRRRRLANHDVCGGRGYCCAGGGGETRRRRKRRSPRLCPCYFSSLISGWESHDPRLTRVLRKMADRRTEGRWLQQVQRETKT